MLDVCILIAFEGGYMESGAWIEGPASALLSHALTSATLLRKESRTEATCSCSCVRYFVTRLCASFHIRKTASAQALEPGQEELTGPEHFASPF